MEVINDNIDDVNRINDGKISVNASEIIKKFRALKDRQLFCKEMSKTYSIKFRFIFPSRTWIRYNFFFTVPTWRQKGK